MKKIAVILIVLAIFSLSFQVVQADTDKPKCHKGDATGDGIIDMGDVTMIERIILGMVEENKCADANRDKVVDMGDAVGGMRSVRICILIWGLW